MDRVIAVPRVGALSLRDYPHEFMPPMSDEIFQADLHIVGAGTTYTFNAGQTIVIPNQKIGWLKEIAVQLSAFGGATGVSWSLLINGVPLRNYTNIPVPIGALGTPLRRSIKLPPLQPVQLQFKNTGGAPVTAQWSLYGWYYSGAMQ